MIDMKSFNHNSACCVLKPAHTVLSLVRLFRLPLLLSSLLPALLVADDSRSGSTKPPVDYAIIVTGGELLSGAYADGHTFFLTRTLRPLGLRCVGSTCVDDNEADLKEALRYATGKASLVVVTGGLGPTDNDITRQTLSDFTEIPLAEHPDVLEAMARRFRVSPDRLRKNLRIQTRVPSRGTYLKNPNGSAVGLVFELADAVIVALPGPPRELQAMVRDELVPYLNRQFGTRMPGCSLMLRFVGLGQSNVDQTLEEHVPLPTDVTLSSQFEGGRVDFTFSLPDDTSQDRARLDELKNKILKHLGDYVYADDDTSLEQRVVQMLEARGEMVSLAEVESGGSLAAGLNTADGANRVLAGAYVAPTEEQLRRLLRVPDDKWTDGLSSTQRTELLALAAAELTGSTWAVAVGEAQRAENGGRHVEVVVRPPGGPPENRRIGLRGDGQYGRSRLITQLLDQLRRRLR
jgi:nicotinamide-nucleotide amidase